MESSTEIYKIMKSQNQELKLEIKELKKKIKVLENLKVSIVRFQDLIYEDDLPAMTDQEYKEWFKTSVIVDGVRMGNDPAKKSNVNCDHNEENITEDSKGYQICGKCGRYGADC